MFILCAVTENISEQYQEIILLEKHLTLFFNIKYIVKIFSIAVFSIFSKVEETHLQPAAFLISSAVSKMLFTYRVSLQSHLFSISTQHQVPYRESDKDVVYQSRE